MAVLNKLGSKPNFLSIENLTPLSAVSASSLIRSSDPSLTTSLIISGLSYNCSPAFSTPSQRTFDFQAISKCGSIPEEVPAMRDIDPVGAIVVTEECLIPTSVSISSLIKVSFKSPLNQADCLYSGKAPLT